MIEEATVISERQQAVTVSRPAGIDRRPTGGFVRRLSGDFAEPPASPSTVDTRHAAGSLVDLSGLDTQVMLPAPDGGRPVMRPETPAGAVFVDHSGRRRRLLRWCGGLLTVACLGFAGLIALSVLGARPDAPRTSIPGGTSSSAPPARAAAAPPRPTSHPATTSARRGGGQPVAAPGHPTPTRSTKRAPTPSPGRSKAA